MKKTLLIAAAAVGIFAGIRAFLGGDKGPETAPPAPAAVRVALPRTENIEIGASYLGTVHSRRDVRVIARVPGTVSELPKREGETAAEGDLLAVVDAPDIEAQIERLTADRDYWARRHEADKRLVEKNALAPDQALIGEKNLKTTEAALKEALSGLGKTREKAPFAGTVLSRFVEPGQSVLPGQPILHFGSGAFEVRVEAVEEDLRRGLGAGTEADVEAGDGGRIRTRVSEVSPAAGGQSRTFTVKIPLPAGTGPALRVGSSIRVTFITASRRNALTLPAGAVAERNGDPHIFLVRDGRAFRQAVKPGIESRGRIVVDFPWNGLDKAVVSNLRALTDGTEVFAVDAGEEAE
jgi:membrane fusion protein (multidrug efflux system)